MNAIPSKQQMIDAVMKSGCENMRRLDLMNMSQTEIYTKLLAVKCPCLQALMKNRPPPHTTLHP